MHDDPQTRLRRAARELGAAAAVPRPHAVRARGHQRRRRGALGSGLLVLALLAGGGTAYLTVARQQAAAPPLTRSTRAHSMLPAGKVGPRSAVPWSQVGPGWALAGYTQGWPYAGRASLRKPAILYLVNPLAADGTGVRQITAARNDDYAPAWSPHGPRIAFVRGLEQPRVYVMNLHGGGLRAAARGYTVAWSPDGKWLAISRIVHDKAAIFLVRPNGRDLHRLIPAPIAGDDPNWSPDGQKLAFTLINNLQGPPSTQSSDIAVIARNGTGLTRVTHSHPGLDTGPAWSPSGSKIVFDRSIFKSMTFVDRLYIVHIPAALGAMSQRRLGLKPGIEGIEPDWQPLVRKSA